MKTIVSIIGTRPEATKMMPVLRELARHEDVRSIVIATGQHREMLRQTFATLGITPDYDLDLMQPNQTLAGLTANLLNGLDSTLAALTPDWIVAQGDTTTVMVASLLAYYRQIPFAHVEAGLRTGDLFSPFPEELNRRIADLIASAYFAPTEVSAQTLRREGVPTERIYVTGNTGVDAALIISQRPFEWQSSPLASIHPSRPMVLITAHRRENFGEPLERICAAIAALAARYPQVAFVYSVHLNPNVQQVVKARLGSIPNVHLLPPLDYAVMVQAMRHAHLIMTDSGGIQEEAPSFGVPLLVLRESTERPEGVSAGCARLVGTDTGLIVESAIALLDQPGPPRHNIPNPYGDGHAAARIVATLRQS